MTLSREDYSEGGLTEYMLVNTVVPESGIAHQEVTVQTRAPRMCNLCRSLIHTARTCPTKQASN